MNKIKNFLIKREQSQARLSFAKREKSRLLAKTILTLVALIAVTTGAWAQGKLIYEKDFSSDAFYPFYLDAADQTGASATVTDGLLVVTNPKVQATNWDVQPEIGRLTSAAPTTQGNTYRVVMQYKTTVAGSVTFAFGAQDWSNADWSGQTITVSNDFQTCEAYFNNYPYSNSESHILLQFGELVGTITIKKVEVYELYPFDGISWTASTKTATIASMPAGNVFVVPEYYPQAALTAAPTAINDVPATTDGAIVKAGTVANIGSTETAQGTVMYYVSQTALDDAALLALAADQWKADVPTAAHLTEGQAYVYYYVRGNDSDTDEENFSDGDILAANALTVTIAAEPTYDVTFAEGTDPNEWTASPNADVKKGQTVTVTYTGSKKVIGVKAEKKAPVTYPMVSEATASDYGKVVCAAGHLHDAKTAVPTGCTAVAIFAYIDGGNNRIAIALQDGEAATWYTLTTDGANNNTLCSVPGTWTVTAPTDAEWFVGTKAIYEAIFTNLGSTTGDSDGKTYDDNVNAYITTVGGKALSGGYWSTSEKSESIGWDFGSGCWYNDYKTYGLKVRPVLAW